MIRSVLAVAAGYISITVLTSFLHLIAAVYSNSEWSLTGIADLPSEGWQYSVTGLMFIFGIIGGLLTTTLSKTSGHLEILILIFLVLATGFIDYRALANSEPMWYLIASPFLKTSGIFLGYRIKRAIDLTSTFDPNAEA